MKSSFQSDSDYEEFAHYIRHIGRHFLDHNQLRFIDNVLATSDSRAVTLPEGQVLWRAAIGYVAGDGVFPHDECFFDCIRPHPVERMKPRKERATEGRINSKGIPCLYTATDSETALTETRPWAGSVLTLSEVILLSDTRLIDCSIPTTFQVGDDLTQQEREKNNWHVINRAFSEPVGRNDDVADYAPTQFLGEAFRNAGYGGIIYASKLGAGKNVALFDIEVADIASTRLCWVKDVVVRFEEYGLATYVDKYKQQFGIVDDGTLF